MPKVRDVEIYGFHESKAYFVPCFVPVRGHCVRFSLVWLGWGQVQLWSCESSGTLQGVVIDRRNKSMSHAGIIGPSDQFV